MTPSTSAESTNLLLARIFKAPREKVFEAWTNPEVLQRWFGPSDDFATPSVEVDLQIGGRYRIHLKAPNGESHILGHLSRNSRSRKTGVYLVMGSRKRMWKLRS